MVVVGLADPATDEIQKDIAIFDDNVVVSTPLQ